MKEDPAQKDARPQDAIRRFVIASAVSDAAAPRTVPPAVLDEIFISERPALSLIGTLARRGHATQSERLYSAARLAEWSTLAGVPRLTTEPSAAQLAVLHELREAIFELFVSHVAPASAPASVPSAASLQTINAWATTPLSVALAADGRTYSETAPFTIANLSGLVAVDAIDLVAGAWAGRLRRCERQPCGHFFLDRSVAGGRRWCTSSGCGNRARVQAHRQVRAQR